MKQADIELPLYNAFMQLMKLERNQPNKGIDPGSYLQLIDVLHKGYALNSKEELIFFCKKLWLKPFHKGDAAITEQVLEEIILNNLQVYEAGMVKKNAKLEDKQPDTNEATGPLSNEEDVNGEEEANKEEEAPANDRTLPEKQYLPAPGTTTKLVINIEESAADNAFDQQDYSHYFNDRKFKFNYTYLTVSPRFIEQTVRSLRYKVKGAGKPVIDMEVTVKDVGSKGYFDKWFFSEEEDFVTRWTLLFDREGSMVAFHGLQDVIAAAAINGTIRNDGDLFYFHNIARDYLYTNAQRTHSVPFAELAYGPVRNILVISDAGAARGSFNESRIRQTEMMIYHLRKHRIAWLNPLPKVRWKNSSAYFIAGFVNMFEPGDDYSDDLGNIVRLFKSKIVTPILY
jgi:hypothetical protein